MNIYTKLSLEKTIAGNHVFPTGSNDLGVLKFMKFVPMEITKIADALEGSDFNSSLEQAKGLQAKEQVTVKAVQSTISKLATWKPAPVNGIVLPIPSNLQDGMQYGFNVSQMGRFYGAFATAAKAGNYSGDINSILEGAKKDLVTSAVSNFVGVAGAAIGADANGLVSSLIGTPNSFMKLNFTGSNFKSHNFRFSLTPRNFTDSKKLQTIIKIFKYYSAPIGRDSSIFDVKHVWKVYFSKDIRNATYKFAPCYLTSVNVTYNTQGISAFHTDGMPIDVILDLHFVEMVVMSQETLNEIYDGDYLGEINLETARQNRAADITAGANSLLSANANLNTTATQSFTPLPDVPHFSAPIPP